MAFMFIIFGKLFRFRTRNSFSLFVFRQISLWLRYGRPSARCGHIGDDLNHFFTVVKFDLISSFNKA